MPTAHPSFDVKTKTWFVDQYEAPSLAQLKRLLPRRTKIEGYFHRGFTARRINSNQPTRPLAREPFNLMRQPTSAPRPKRVYTTPHKTNIKKHDHDAILTLWVEGLSGPEISERLDLPRRTTAGGVVARCRELGDPRALSRSTNGHLIAAAFARKRAIAK
jgi:hypothetical protein